MLPTFPETPPVSRRFMGLSLILIAVLGILVYANTLKGQFLWDDEALVLLA